MKNVTMQITDDKWDFYKRVAESRGKSLAELMKQGTEILANFDDKFLFRLRDMSQILNLPEYLILQNLAIDWLARKEAERETLGSVPAALLEFSFTDAGPITGDDLLKILKDSYVQDELSAIEAKQLRGPLNVTEAGLLRKKKKRS